VLAEQRIPSGIAAQIVATVPLWMALIGFLALRERLPRVAVAGLLVGFAGTALLIRPSGEGAVDLLGALTVVGASLAWAIGSLYSRRAPLPARPLVSASMQMLCGGAALGVAGILSGELGRIEPSSFSRSSVLALGYLILFGAVLTFPCYAWLLRSAPTSVVSTYAYVNPVVAVALGWAVVDERVEPMTILAGAVIVAAVAMIVGSRRIEEPGEIAAGAPPVDDAKLTASEEPPSQRAGTVRSRGRSASGTRPAARRRGARR
jgi:drug/metabolite transporter (DMT)-like permease